MMSMALYKREMKGSIKLLIIFSAIITMYVSIIISMYDPELMKTLDSFVEVMPELMASVGMKASAATLLGFMASYLYGFILLIFPMLFCILRGNALIAKYVDKGSMALLAAAPVKRRAIAFTQMIVLVSGILLLVLYTTILELICAAGGFPGELDVKALFALNSGLLCLHLFIGSICFLPAYFRIQNTALLSEQGFPYSCMYCRCLPMWAAKRKKQNILLSSPCSMLMASLQAKAKPWQVYLFS